MELQGEFKKLKPPMFDGELEVAVEAWLLTLNDIFNIQLDDNLRACLAIFQLSEKVYMWWQEAKSINNVRSNELS